MGKKKILIADDEEMSRKILQRFLSSDYEVIEAKDGVEALEKLKSNDIDAMILDIIMPTIDGLTVLEKIHTNEKYKHIGVLVATSTKEQTERESLSLGADDVVSKPYDPTVIKKRLSNIINLKEYQKQAEFAYNNDIQDLLQEHLNAIVDEAKKTARTLYEASDAILENDGNQNLIELMVDNIKIEADHIQNLFDIGRKS